MNADAGKLAKIQETMGWLRQAEIYYKGLRFDIGDDCVKRARGAINDPCFDRQPIPGFSRHQQPEALWVKNPLISGGKMLINSEDFDPSVHQVWEESTPDKPGKRTR